MATKPIVRAAHVSPKKKKGIESKSPNRLAVERFMHNRLAVIGLIVLFLIIVMVICAPLLTHYSPTQLDITNSDSPPSSLHWLGTSNAGTDYWALDMYGGRLDLFVGFADTILVMVIGITLGGLAGYYGGIVDSMIMRVCDFMFNFPFLLLIIVIQATLNSQSIWILILAIAFTGWAGITRFVRGLFLNLRESDYVLAAKMAGTGVWRIIFRHMLPNSLGPLVVQGTFTLANLIGAEAGLALIGFGVPPSTPSWGNILSSVTDLLTLQSEPWAWVPPMIFLTLTILSVNFIGDGLRDAFDPSFQR